MDSSTPEIRAISGTDVLFFSVAYGCSWLLSSISTVSNILPSRHRGRKKRFIGTNPGNRCCISSQATIYIGTSDLLCLIYSILFYRVKPLRELSISVWWWFRDGDEEKKHIAFQHGRGPTGGVRNSPRGIVEIGGLRNRAESGREGCFNCPIIRTKT